MSATNRRQLLSPNCPKRLTLWSLTSWKNSQALILYFIMPCAALWRLVKGLLGTGNLLCHIRALTWMYEGAHPAISRPLCVSPPHYDNEIHYFHNLNA
jgi:hypothetical protein